MDISLSFLNSGCLSQTECLLVKIMDIKILHAFPLGIIYPDKEDA